MEVIERMKLLDGNKIPVIGLGTWDLRSKAGMEVMKEALVLGYRQIDSAEMYGNEAEVGQAVKASGINRAEIFVTTKLQGTTDPAAIEERLDELGLDYIDLLLIHHPTTKEADIELWKAMIAAQAAGKIKSIGVSNFDAIQIATLAEVTGVTPAVNQIKLTPKNFPKKLVKYCQDQKVVLQAYSPLNEGSLPNDPVLSKIAKRQGKTIAQVILRWDIQHGWVTIPKASSTAHLKENLDIFDFELTEEEMSQIDNLSKL